MIQIILSKFPKLHPPRILVQTLITTSNLALQLRASGVVYRMQKEIADDPDGDDIFGVRRAGGRGFGGQDELPVEVAANLFPWEREDCVGIGKRLWFGQGHTERKCSSKCGYDGADWARAGFMRACRS